MIVRAARAARVGPRAGRLSRARSSFCVRSATAVQSLFPECECPRTNQLLFEPALLHKVAKIVRFLSGGEDISQNKAPALRSERRKALACAISTPADIALQRMEQATCMRDLMHVGM